MRYTTHVPMLVDRQFEDEIILANFETGVYYSLTDTAADIWLGLQAGATTEEIVAAVSALAPENGQSRRQSVTDFIDELLNENIILPQDDHTSDPKPWGPQFSKLFSQPILNRYEDLRDLLLLDPVHDVSEAGWPTRAKDGA